MKKKVVRREEEKEENETDTVSRGCEGFVSVEAFKIFGQGRDLESCESDSRARVRMLPDVIDVLVLLSAGLDSYAGRDEV